MGTLLVGQASLVECLVEPLEQRMGIGVRVKSVKLTSGSGSWVLFPASTPTVLQCQQLLVVPGDGMTLRLPQVHVLGVDIGVRLEKALCQDHASLAMLVGSPEGRGSENRFGASVHRAVVSFSDLANLGIKPNGLGPPHVDRARRHPAPDVALLTPM